MKASNLKIGQKAIIKNLNIENKSFRRRLIDMGLTISAIIEIKKISPAGDPIDLYLRGYELILRRADLEDVEVELVEELK